MVAVGPGTWQPPDAKEGEATRVERFLLDARPVTNAELLAFVQADPRWQRDRVPELFAEREYLGHWAGPRTLGVDAPPMQPVTRVSWFAAEAYCAARGARLPTEAEWELAAMASTRALDGRAEPGFSQRILDWYASPAARIGDVGRGEPNAWGIEDLHGLVWEWVHDFGNQPGATAGALSGAGRPEDAFCGAGAAGARDARDYAGFMRAAFRASLEARYTGRKLGFRCARSLAPAPTSTFERAADATGRAFPGSSLYQLGGALRGASGPPVTLAAFAGQPLLLTMFYAGCRSACPVLLDRLLRLDATLPADARARARYVLVSLDPERDTPKALEHLAQRYGLDPARFRLLAGSDATTRALAAALGLRYRRKPDGMIEHGSVVLALDAQGVPRARAEGLWAPYDDLTGVLTRAPGADDARRTPR